MPSNYYFVVNVTPKLLKTGIIHPSDKNNLYNFILKKKKIYTKTKIRKKKNRKKIKNQGLSISNTPPPPPPEFFLFSFFFFQIYKDIFVSLTICSHFDFFLTLVLRASFL
jgi:hypothetical protein